MKKINIILFILLSIANIHAEHEQHGAHEHGVANLNISVDESKITIDLDGPFDNFLGFEYEPVTPQEKDEAEKMVAKLKNANLLFKFSKNANCISKNIDLENNGLPKKNESSHSDLEANFVFECKNINKLKEIEVNLFNIFEKLEELEVQLISPQVQKHIELTAKNNKIKL